MPPNGLSQKNTHVTKKKLPTHIQNKISCNSKLAYFGEKVKPILKSCTLMNIYNIYHMMKLMILKQVFDWWFSRQTAHNIHITDFSSSKLNTSNSTNNAIRSFCIHTDNQKFSLEFEFLNNKTKGSRDFEATSMPLF